MKERIHEVKIRLRLKSDEKMKRGLILIAFVIAAILIISAFLLSQAKTVEVKEVWIKAPDGNKLYCHIHKSKGAPPGNKYPGLVIVPGGSGVGTQFDSGETDDIARQGAKCL